MPAAADAMVLRARHNQLVVLLRGQMAGDVGKEAGPAGAAVELHLGSEKRQRAAGADKYAWPLLVVERARERALGAFLAQHVKLGVAQDLFPLRLGFPERLRRKIDLRVPRKQRLPVLANSVHRLVGFGVRRPAGAEPLHDSHDERCVHNEQYELTPFHDPVSVLALSDILYYTAEGTTRLMVAHA